MRIAKILGAVAAMAMGGAAFGQGVVTYAFTYQGSLTQSGAPATGAYDMEFRLFDDPMGGAQQGATICRDNVSVTDGLFTVPLDFGAQFYGQQRFVEIRVRAGGPMGDCANNPGTYTLLTPRQSVTAAPYALHALSSDDWRRSAGNIFHNDGNVGIGTTNPLSRLHVADSGGGVAARFVGDSWNGLIIEGRDGPGINDSAFLVLRDNLVGGNGAFLGLTASNAPPVGDLRIVTGGAERMRISANGNIGINISSPAEKLQVGGFVGAEGFFIGDSNPSNAGSMGFRSNGPRIEYWGSGTANPGLMYLTTSNPGRIVLAGGNVGIGTLSPTELLDVAGTTRTQVLQITGGSDLAEPFDVSPAADTTAAPGMVVVIDEDRPGELRVATCAYDRKVAGVISGANGLSPGMVMRAADTPKADGEHPVALTGRVWVWCDAASGAIKPGDRLTTSTTPGHAMRVANPELADGAVLGKAMTELKEGRGLVLMLVQPQ